MADLDKDMIEAMREVDALTPATPPIAPPLPPMCSSTGCVLSAQHDGYWCRSAAGQVWPNPRRSGWSYDTGARPEGTRINAQEEFVLPDGTVVSIARVARDGWRKVLEEFHSKERR